MTSPAFERVIREAARWGVQVALGVPAGANPAAWVPQPPWSSTKAPFDDAYVCWRRAPDARPPLLPEDVKVQWVDWYRGPLEACALMHEVAHAIEILRTRSDPTRHREDGAMLAIEAEVARRCRLGAWAEWMAESEYEIDCGPWSEASTYDRANALAVARLAAEDAGLMVGGSPTYVITPARRAGGGSTRAA